MTERPEQAQAEDVTAALPSLPGTEPGVADGGLTERLGEAMRSRMRQRGVALLTPDGVASTLGRMDGGGMVSAYGEEAMQAVVDEGVQGLQDRLGASRRVRSVSLSYRPSYGSRDSLLQADMVLSLWDGDGTAGFAQAGVQSQDGEGGAHIGAGWRADAGGYLLGVNAFYDYLSEPRVDRYSVGGEVRGRWLDLTANWYQGLSEERKGNVEYEAADGWDVELSGHIPGARWLSFAGRYYDFDEPGEGEEGTGQEYRLTIQPWPLLGLSGFYDVPEGSEADNDAGFEARMEWRFGVSLAEQMRAGRVQTAQRAWHRRYERVRREYDVRIAETGMRGVTVGAPVVTATAITLSWRNPAGATRVRISWRPLAGSPVAPVVNASGASGPPALQDRGMMTLDLTGAGQSQTYPVSGLSPGTRYEFTLDFLRVDDTVLLTVRREASTEALQVSFGAATATVAEDAGTVSVSVSLNGSPAGNLTIPVMTSDGTATAGSDYTALTQDLTFAAGASGAALMQTVSVSITDDSAGESDETFTVGFGTLTGVTAGTPNRVTVTITDDDAPTAVAPGAPTGLMASAVSATQIDLSWTAPAVTGGAAITGYKIEVSTDGTAFSDLVADTGNRMVTYSHTGLSASTTRHYRVSAINAVGTGATSTVAMATTTTVAAVAPGAPTGLMASAVSATQIDLSWMAPAVTGGAAITGYRIEVSTDGTTFSDLEDDTGSTATTYSHTGLMMGVTRHYRVSAINSVGTGTVSAVAMATTTAAAVAPGAPTMLTATAVSATQIDLSWMAPANTGGAAITGYRIEVSTDGGTNFNDLEDDTGNRMVTYSHTGLTAGTTRHYRVSAINSAGTGTASAVAMARTHQVPGAPTGLMATAAGPTQIDLNWTAPAVTGGTITGYKIEVSTDGTAFSDLEDDTGSTATTYNHTGLTASTTRHYRVSAINSAGTGTASTVAMATTTAAAVAPGAPTGLMASAVSATRIDLSWTEPANIGGAAITGYRIEVSTDGTAFSDLEDDTGSTATTYSHTGLTAGTTRHYRVSAINSAGTGTASAVAMARTHQVPGAPTGLMATAAGPTQIDLSWTAPAVTGGTITGYRIEVSTDGTAFSDLVGDTGSAETTYNHTGLTGGTTRHYRVSAINSAGTGTASTVAMATTAAAAVAPGAPTMLTATAASATQIDLSWMAPANIGGAAITGYRIEVSTDGGTAFSDLVADTGSAETTYNHNTGLTAGTTRHYRVSAINSAGTGTASAVAMATTHTAPGAPTSLMATAASATQINLSWTEPVNIGGTAITGYRIEVSTDGGTAFTDLVADTGNRMVTYSHTGLTAGTTRHYRVSAINAAGTGTASAVAMARTHTAPGAPTGLMASAVSATRIDLSWTAPAVTGGTITGYRIEVSTDGTTFSDLVGDTGSAALTYSHTGLTGGTTRHYRVSAINAVGTGTASTVAMATTTAAAVAPGAPTMLTATAASATRIDLSWMEPANIGGAAITGYRIEVSTDGTTFNDLEDDTGSTALTYNHTGLTAGATRHYRVSAINSAGTGTASAVAMATTHTAPGAPTMLTATAVSATRIDLSWMEPANIGGAAITGYRIEVSTDGTTFSDLEDDTGSAETTYNHTGLTMGTTRHYQVSAINSAGTGTASAVAMATTHTAPGAPTMLTATAVSATRIDLSWMEPANIGGAAITGYRIEVSTDGTTFSDLEDDTGNRMVTYNHTGLTAGSTRHYRVSAINSAGTGTASAVAMATTHTVPGAPTGLMATAASRTQIDLSWTAPAVTGGTITGYRIEVSTDGTTFSDLEDDTGNAETTYNHMDLTAGTARHYRVSAINSAGTGTASAVAMATTHTAPGAPTGLMATAASRTQIDLSWTAPAVTGGTITGYRIEVSTDGTTFSDLEDDTGSAETTYNHMGLMGGTTRHYRVSAINAVGTGTASTVAMATTTAAVVPGFPTMLTATAVSATRIDLEWMAPADTGGAEITGYRILVSTDNGNSFGALVSNTGNAETMYSHTGLTGGTTRHYRVAAINSVGAGFATFVSAIATTPMAPGAPTGLMATAVSVTQIDLNWTEPANIGGAAITGYRIEVSTDGTTFSDLEDDTGNAETTYNHMGLTGGTTRHYRVSAINSAGTGTASAAASATTLMVGAPTGLAAAAASATRIDLSWTAPSPATVMGSAIDGYRIEVSTDGGTTYADQVSDTGNTNVTYSHTGLTMGTTRHYRVYARNASDQESPVSNVASATTHTAPGAPTGLMATAASTTQINLSWTAPADPDGAPITGYRIEVSTDGTTFSDLVADTGNRMVTYSHTGLTMGTTRHYQVSAINAVGTGTASAVAMATTHTAPGAPTGLMATAASRTQIDLSWTAPAVTGGTITGYRIEVSTDGTTFSDLEDDTGSAETTYNHMGLTAGTARHYRVSAINAIGTGTASAVAMATTAAAVVPGFPTMLTATAVSATRIDLEWMAPADNGGAEITGYRILVSTDNGNSFGALVSNTGNAETTYSHTGLTGGTTRHYRVAAINSVGAGFATLVSAIATTPTP